VNFGGRRRRAAEIAALKLEEFTFSISRLSTSIRTCKKIETWDFDNKEKKWGNDHICDHRLGTSGKHNAEEVWDGQCKQSLRNWDIAGSKQQKKESPY
jgi:hypothetical protein